MNIFQNKLRMITTTLLLAGLCTVCLTGCSTPIKGSADKPSVTIPSTSNTGGTPDKSGGTTPSSSEPTQPAPQPDKSPTDYPHDPAKTPDSITVLVNKQSNALPDGYRPADLYDDPNLPFIFSGHDEKRLMRKPAAEALEKLFAGAKKDGILLAGVSGFRSYELQKSLFDGYVQQQGEAEARRYSAVPGHSEHQTGLAIDVSGSTGACAAENCFGDTQEAKWLAKHAYEYGFIIRYPQGKEAITGYAYESWHLRYVGLELAKTLNDKGLTMEEYFAGK
ncbi:D-alanyl-D-alanine carboxypeptidase family protein [Tumebacillus sp. ITR2]|uniref:D-alanyl-D-alanine carboxypeptidase family protein n=1 Tax=Tumebacillus amylolyticus TaxID=2801339 RepID=A0ABS1J5Z8_9BACL|nr:M15 family metallopeptidase [Tumebacillus amylolyticus]MBL0385691.1 D-alanyl-D-alanine carboxypeptidase family protein [Tumebacillus amylolyticus]